MTVGLQVDVQGIALVEAELDRLSRRGHDLTRANKAIGAALESVVQQRFDTKTDPLGHPWAAHSAATIAAYKAQDTNKRGKHSKRGSLLERTRRMRNSLGFVADASSIVIGFGVPYAIYPEFGTKHAPRRGLLMADPVAGTLSASDVDIILSTLIKHFSI